jgi:hypothetical protein
VSKSANDAESCCFILLLSRSAWFAQNRIASALFFEAICDILVMKRDEEEGRSKFKSPPAGDHDGASEVASFTNRGTKISVLLLLPERLIRGYALAAPWLIRSSGVDSNRAVLEI